MLSVKCRPKPGSASTAARSVGVRRATSSTTTGRPSAKSREVGRLSASVSVMSPTLDVRNRRGRWAGRPPTVAPGPGAVGRRPPPVPPSGSRPVRRRALDHLVAPQVVGVARRGGQAVAAAVVRPGELLALLPRAVCLLALPPRVDQVLVGALQGAQQLEPLEARGLLDLTRPAAEALLEAVLLVLRHHDRVDLDDAHAVPLPATARCQSRMLEA